MANVGCRIYQDFKRPDKELIEAFRGIPVANIDDCMGRIACCGSELMAMNKVPLLGTAFTVKAPEGDNLMFHKALEMAQPGDILVIAAGGSKHRSLCGEIMSMTAIAAGIKGFIVDGCIRDKDEIGEFTNFSVYATGVTPNGPYKNGPGEINVPVSVCGQVICPGDILVGDGDGVVVIKPEEAAELARKAKAVSEMEVQQKADILSGKGLQKPWLDEKLKELGCEII
ncbi:MAG: RraA family protein [Lachnospiraceae bacterium]